MRPNVIHDPSAPACPRCGSADTAPLRNYGRPVRGRFECYGCRRWFGPENPTDAGGTGEPAAAAIVDPFPAGALLAAAVLAHCQATGESKASVARRAGLDPHALYRAEKDPNASTGTMRAICLALGLRVALHPTRESGGAP